MPVSFLSTIIPMPSEMALESLQTLAIFTFGDRLIVFRWWAEHRKVIVHSDLNHTWYIQDDLDIRTSLADILDWGSHSVAVDSLMLYDDATYRHGLALPPALERVFLDCEWSDYACDHRPISGRVFKKDLSAAADSSDSLSDDETSISPRKYNRFVKQSWK